MSDTPQHDEHVERRPESEHGVSAVETKKPKPLPGTPTTKRSAPTDAAAIARRAIARYVALTADGGASLELLAAAAGLRADPVELATTLATGELKLTALADLASIATAVATDPFEGAFAAAGLDREQARAVWALMVALGIATGNLPGREQQAAVAIARAAAQFSDEHRSRLDALRRLTRR